MSCWLLPGSLSQFMCLLGWVLDVHWLTVHTDVLAELYSPMWINNSELMFNTDTCYRLTISFSHTQTHHMISHSQICLLICLDHAIPFCTSSLSLSLSLRLSQCQSIWVGGLEESVFERTCQFSVWCCLCLPRSQWAWKHTHSLMFFAVSFTQS